jgi:hypothetical protein
MGGQMNLGDRLFKTKSQGLSLPPAQKDRQYFNFEVGNNTLTGVVNSFGVYLLDALQFPFAVYLEHIQLFGDYHDSASGLAKQQPQVSGTLFATGATFPTLGTLPPTYTVGLSSTMGSGVNFSGILNSKVEYRPALPVFIPPQTNLQLRLSVNFFAATAGTDVLITSVRLVFSN